VIYCCYSLVITLYRFLQVIGIISTTFFGILVVLLFFPSDELLTPTKDGRRSPTKVNMFMSEVYSPSPLLLGFVLF